MVLRRLAALLLALSLAGCGWQLRGAGGGFEGTVLRIEGDVEQRIQRLAEAELLDLGGAVAGSAERADGVLVITEASSRRRTVSVDARGRSQEEEVIVRIGFRVEPPTEAAERPRLAAQTVTTSDAFAVDPLETQAVDARQDQLRGELEVEAVRRMLARVARAL